MGKYYLVIFFASLLFSVNTFFNKTYQKNEGESFEKLMLFMWVSSVCGVLYGFIFNGEGINVTKAICIVLLIIALFVSVGKISDCKGLFYCILVFFANGMYGVITSIYKTKSTVYIPDANYNMFVLLYSFIISSAMLLYIVPKYKKAHESSLFTLNKPKQSYPAAFFYILSNGIGNFLLLWALSKGVEVSIQYPVITGGTIIFSTVLSILLKEKVPKRNFIAVAIAFGGLVAVCF